MQSRPSTLTATRRQTAARLRGLELPESFAVSGAASEALLLAKSASERTAANRRDLKRAAAKCRAIEVRRG